MKVLCLSIMLMVGVAGCGKSSNGALQSPGDTQAKRQARAHGIANAVLTKEEVGAILGQPVTSVEGAVGDTNYKTDVIGLEVVIGLEPARDPTMAFSGARKATNMLGGMPEDVPNLGDEAFFGAMSILYVRKGDIVITITPPNLGLVAASAAYEKVTEAKTPEEQRAAMQNLAQIEKTDPTNAGLKQADDTQGALAVVAASSKKQGTAYETQARIVAQALAAKVLTKL
jgi:hypothetical protein